MFLKNLIEKRMVNYHIEAMDKGSYIDENWFEGDKYSKKGDEIIAKIEKYRFSKRFNCRFWKRC